MWELFSASQNLPFSVALTVMFAIAVLEGVSTLLGAALSGLVDSVLPDLDADLDLDVDAVVDVDVDADLAVDADADADLDAGHLPALSRFLGWLRVGEVPVLVLLIIFLTAFGVLGLTLQAFFRQALGGYLTAPVAVVPALILALPTVRLVGGLIAHVLPKDETEAVAENSFVGRVAVVTLGTATPGRPAEAKVRDDFGKTHYVMVEPAAEQDVFGTGTEVLLKERFNGRFRGVRRT